MGHRTATRRAGERQPSLKRQCLLRNGERLHARNRGTTDQACERRGARLARRLVTAEAHGAAHGEARTPATSFLTTYPPRGGFDASTYDPAIGHARDHGRPRAARRK